MKKITLIVLTLLLSLSAWSQESNTNTNRVTKANYELAARFSPKKVGRLVGSTGVRPSWFKDSDKFWYSWRSPNGINYYVVDPVTGKKTELFDNGKIAAQLTEIVRDPFDAQNIPFRRLMQKDEETFTFEIRSTAKVTKKDEKTDKEKKENKVHGFEYKWRSQTLTEIEGYETPKGYPGWGNVSPDHKYVLFSRDFNIYYMDWENYEKAKKDDKDSTIVEHQLTFDGTMNFPYGDGESDPEANEEAKNRRRAARVLWSPDSKSFISIRSNYEKVKDLWVINHLAQPRPKLERYKYHMAGEATAPSRHLYLFDMESKEAREIKSAAFKDQELGLVPRQPLKRAANDTIKYSIWLGNSEGPYVTRTSRDLKRIDLCVADFQADSLRTIVEERLNTYVEIQPPVPAGNDTFVWWSERSGWAHLYLYDNSGNLKKQLTSGEFHVERIDVVDPARKVVYFTANAKEEGENPYYQHLYRVNLDGSNLKLLNPGNWDHQTDVSDNGQYFIDTYSRVDTTPKVALYDNNGRKVLELEEADLSQLLEMGYKFPETFTVKAGDGKTDLYGVMYKPFDFDSTKVYPLIEYVYPGPQTEAVNASWSVHMDRVDRLAQLGFIVITVGNRGGHPARSKWYHNYGYGNLRDYGLEDKKVVAEKLAARHPFIDLDRVGIHGHSGGGFMSTAAMLVYPDFFKAAVSSAGNHENNIYNRWWSEKHHGVLEEISASGDTTFKYNIARNSQIAKNLKGRLLLVTGDIDNNVHPANTYVMANALIRANKRFDMLVLPGQRHGFGDMTEYFFWRMADYFSKHLIGDYRDEVEIPQMNND